MKQILVVAIVAVLLCASALLGQSGHWVWKEYVYPKDGFAITLPLPPAPAHKDLNNPNMTVYTVHFTADSSFSVRVVNEKRDCATTLNQLKDGALHNKQPNQPINPSAVKDLSVGGYSGVEYEFRFDPEAEAYERYVCVKGRFYIFSAHWPIKQPRPAAVDRAVDSFRLL